jgi:hypothetical protein
MLPVPPPQLQDREFKAKATFSCVEATARRANVLTT